ncbi:MAG TPA: hypothetical protein VFQ77_01425 [Pseudonocardiaceae bacterium]|nr:hypothetical protein [Pseudonocardiaceae bacterium]
MAGVRPCGCGSTSERDFLPGHETRAIMERVREHFDGSPLKFIQWVDATLAGAAIVSGAKGYRHEPGRAVRAPAPHRYHPGLGRVHAAVAGGHDRYRARLGAGHRPADLVPGRRAGGPLRRDRVDAMLDLALAINTGAFGNVFA